MFSRHSKLSQSRRVAENDVMSYESVRPPCSGSEIETRQCEDLDNLVKDLVTVLFKIIYAFICVGNIGVTTK